MVCHLGDACRMATGAKPVRGATGRVLPALVKLRVRITVAAR
jgi:hypothetical protein